MDKELYRKCFDKIGGAGKTECPKLYVFDSIGSTNDVLSEYAGQGSPEGTIVIAGRQTDGHGRSGRSFYSPEGGNLYISILLRPDSAEKINMITPAAAVAVSRAIGKVCHKEVSIKWVNDLYYRSKKICGILAQGYGIGTGDEWYVVLGIGVNVRTGAGKVPDEIKDVYGTLYDESEEEKSGLCTDMISAELASEIYEEFMNIYLYDSNNDFIAEYKDRSMVIGKEVSYVCGDSVKPIFVENIDDSGRLIVRDENGIIKIYSDGEIRIKL